MDERLALSVAASVAAMRDRLGLRQRDLAARAGTTQSAIARLEAGTSLPSLSTLAKVADARECNVEVRLVPRSNSPQASRRAHLDGVAAAYLDEIGRSPGDG